MQNVPFFVVLSFVLAGPGFAVRRGAGPEMNQNAEDLLGWWCHGSLKYFIEEGPGTNELRWSQTLGRRGVGRRGSSGLLKFDGEWFEGSLTQALQVRNGLLHIGDRVKVLWNKEKDKWYAGKVQSFSDNGKTTIVYDDGDIKEYDMNHRTWKTLTPADGSIGDTIRLRLQDDGDIISKVKEKGSSDWHVTLAEPCFRQQPKPKHTTATTTLPQCSFELTVEGLHVYGRGWEWREGHYKRPQDLSKLSRGGRPVYELYEKDENGMERPGSKILSTIRKSYLFYYPEDKLWRLGDDPDDPTAVIVSAYPNQLCPDRVIWKDPTGEQDNRLEAIQVMTA